MNFYLCCGNKTGVADPDAWIGIDIFEPCDILLDVSQIMALPRAKRVFATPPCSSFTDLPWRPASNKDRDILLACYRLCKTAPEYLLECNRWAQKFIGPADFHRGPHYFWGNLLVPEFKRAKSKESMSGGSRANSLKRAALPEIIITEPEAVS